MHRRPVKRDRRSAPLEEIERVGAAAASRHLNGGSAVAVRQRRIGAMVEQELDRRQSCCRGGRLGGAPPVPTASSSSDPRRVQAPGGDLLDHANRTCAEAGVLRLRAFSLPLSSRIFRYRVVARFDDMIRRLFVVGIRAALQQQSRQLCVLGDPGRAVDRGFEERAGDSGGRSFRSSRCSRSRRHRAARGPCGRMHRNACGPA